MRSERQQLAGFPVAVKVVTQSRVRQAGTTPAVEISPWSL
jgi:hypothetical protein